MASFDPSAQRLFVDAALNAGASVELDGNQANYLKNVLRLGQGDAVLLFNGRDGEWLAHLAEVGKRRVGLTVEQMMRPQTAPGDLWYLFAPLKHARLDYMVEKAVEMGASRLQPVFTRRTQAARVNLDRMRANAIEAAEQCGILAIPDVGDPIPLDHILGNWPDGRRLIFCDEDAAGEDTLATLRAVPPGPLAVLIGPEGGFDPVERAKLLKIPAVTRISLGPRILRADTAAVAALAVVQSMLGDWRAS